MSFLIGGAFPVRFLPELPRRDAGMDGLGDRDVVTRRAGVLCLYSRQPGSQGL